jgi:hypothetical protein
MDAIRRHIDEAIACLPPDGQDAMILRYIQGLTEAETAKELGWPAETVASRISEGLETIRAHLERNGYSVDTGTLPLPLDADRGFVLPPGFAEHLMAICTGRAPAPPAVADLANAIEPLVPDSGVVRRLP